MKRIKTIAIASGKGGTGKTSLSVNLASHCAVNLDEKVFLFDLDVEEPNTNVFFETYRKQVNSTEINMKIPVIDKNKCTLCGECATHCNFNALVKMKESILLLKEMCKGCKRCFHNCKEGAITYIDEPIGTINAYNVQNLEVVEGLLHIGNIHSKELISHVKKTPVRGFVLYDAPPGTTCPMVESIVDVDYVILVTEPTPFGLNDLSLAIDVVKTLNKGFGIVINKSGDNDTLIEDYCKKNNYSILGKIPFSRELAVRCSSGDLYYREDPYVSILDGIIKKCREALG